MFNEFNTDGSWMSASDDSGEIWRDLIDSYQVTRVAPHFDAQGNITSIDFWLFFKWVGYNNGFQYSHTIKVVGYGQEDTYELDLVDDRGRKYHIELLMAVAERDYIATLTKWRRYKSENRELFESIDAELLEEHLEIAEGW